jgi:hypothetical protein
MLNFVLYCVDFIFENTNGKERVDLYCYPHYIEAYNVAGNFIYKQKITTKNMNDKHYANEYEKYMQCAVHIT